MPDLPNLVLSGQCACIKIETSKLYVTFQCNQCTITDVLYTSVQLLGYCDEILDMRFLGGPAPRLAVATNSEQVKVLARGGSLDWQLLHGHSRVVLSLDAFVPPPPLRPLLVSSSKDHTVRVWGEEEEGSEGRSSEFICKGVGSGHTEAVGAVAFGRSGFTVHLPASHIGFVTRIHCVPEVCKNKESLSTLRCCGIYVIDSKVTLYALSYC